MLGDVVGNDGAPEIAIGRLPITTGEELGRIIDVIESFEASHESMDALFAADDSEHDEFASATRLLTEWVAPERVQEIDLNTETREDARDRLLSMWGSLSWMTYVGHSGLDRMATEGLLTLADVPTLAPMSSAPFVVGWTCNMVRFDIPGFSSLGEQLLTEGASAGVFSATGWSNHFETDLLRTAFAEAVFASEAETIGEAMIRAHKAATDASVPQHRVYMLLGDPALRLRSAPAQPDPEPLPPMDSTPGSTPDANPGPVGAGDDPAASALGCEIAPSGAGHGPYGLGVLLLGAVLLIRRRRASPQRRSDLH
jgi:MYXO-CTERM domain-containing protein